MAGLALQVEGSGLRSCAANRQTTSACGRCCDESGGNRLCFPGKSRVGSDVSSRVGSMAALPDERCIHRQALAAAVRSETDRDPAFGKRADGPP